ncbi:hypothetical protein [Lactiplantibacillus plantarum]|uniref:hypothetical protein n=1 Tax=Lactiplantibacillus plantarum TaxID=1590 RepID=UPI000FECDB03|nr:hypothetical protein [Lactiplantibacillus plantarum]QAR37506.1 hypothetical protein EQJ27_05965 [Lactiplantibacillus plantarum]RWZ07681.1 hypothetical protein EQG51_05965 [Lactiplantibacillus plantarum]RWZ35521.1 hypothetical protein EQG59_05965 [Lactiplantibacillus plantarum]
MDIQEKLNAKYDNIAIYTSGFYADPEDELGTRSKLSETLKSFTMNQHADTPFSLQIMTTNGEINVMPLGLLSLDELKAYETKRREQAGLTTDDDAIPLVVQFAPQTEKEQIQKQIVGTTQDLFDNFNTHFAAIWTVVKADLQANQTLLVGIERDLISDSADIQREYQDNFKLMDAPTRKAKLGFDLKDTDLTHFSTFMADMHEIQAIVLSSAAFVKNELLGDDLFAQVMNDKVSRNTLFWVLDNTFYETLYYFIEKYCDIANGKKLTRHLHHQKKLLIINMRNDAYQRAQAAVEDVTTKLDMDKYFSDIFVPIAEQLAREVDQFQN